MFKKYKFVIFAFLALALIGIIYSYMTLYAGNVNKDKFELKIKKGDTFDSLLFTLQSENVLKNISSFKQVASMMKYQKNIPTGRYLLKKGMSNKSIVSKLRSGDQDPINLTFNNVWNIEQLAGKLSKELASDSLVLLSTFTNQDILKKYNLTTETAMTLFLPNSYDIFWDISPEKMMSRMAQESNNFWSKQRLEKASKLSLTQQQVYTLASIVERESNNKSERSRIAGVYLNRLRIGDKLRADPTVVFANGDFLLKRVLFQHLNFDSPYNTYMYAGLPPGPIFMPSIHSIDAVLNAESHDYFFFCAKPGYSSEHAFAKTAEQHQQNANIYHKWLTAEGIK